MIIKIQENLSIFIQTNNTTWNESITTNREQDISQYVSDDAINWNKSYNGSMYKIKCPGSNNSRNIDRTNLQTHCLNEKGVQKVPILSPRTLLSCFATHDETIKDKIDAGIARQKQANSGRKSHKINKNSKTTLNEYLKFKPKSINISKRNKSTNWYKKVMKSQREKSTNNQPQKKYWELLGAKKNFYDKNKENSNRGNSISIDTQLCKHASIYECNTQQASAVKLPSRLISDKKQYHSILKDSKPIETQKTLFPQTSKNNVSKGR